MNEKQIRKIASLLTEDPSVFLEAGAATTKQAGVKKAIAQRGKDEQRLAQQAKKKGISYSDTEATARDKKRGVTRHEVMADPPMGKGGKALAGAARSSHMSTWDRANRNKEIPAGHQTAQTQSKANKLKKARAGLAQPAKQPQVVPADKANVQGKADNQARQAKINAKQLEQHRAGGYAGSRLKKSGAVGKSRDQTVPADKADVKGKADKLKQMRQPPAKKMGSLKQSEMDKLAAANKKTQEIERERERERGGDREI